MNKLARFNVWQVKLDMFENEAWLNTKSKAKDKKCENCGKKYEDYDGRIALATFKDRLNAHVCKECGEYLISLGAIDINAKAKINENKKGKFVKQAKRLGIQEYSWKKLSDLSIDKLRNKIIDHISNERKKFQEFLSVDSKVIESFVEACNEECPKYKINAYDVWSDPYEYFYEYDEELSRDSHRWIDYISVRREVAGRIFEWDWATCNGDNSLEDNGFDFNFDSLIEIDKKSDAIKKAYHLSRDLIKAIEDIGDINNECNDLLSNINQINELL